MTKVVAGHARHPRHRRGRATVPNTCEATGRFPERISANHHWYSSLVIEGLRLIPTFSLVIATYYLLWIT